MGRSSSWRGWGGSEGGSESNAVKPTVPPPWIAALYAGNSTFCVKFSVSIRLRLRGGGGEVMLFGVELLVVRQLSLWREALGLYVRADHTVAVVHLGDTPVHACHLALGEVRLAEPFIPRYALLPARLHDVVEGRLHRLELHFRQLHALR